MTIFFAVLFIFMLRLPLEMLQGSSSFLGNRTLIIIVLVILCSGLVSMGIALYALRSRARLLYGSIEVALSILMMWFSLVDLIAKSDSHGFVDMGLQFSATYFGMLQVAAAIYVFVRGMDNCGEGLKRYPNLYERWVLIFPTRKELPITIFQKIEELGRKKPE